MASQLSSTRVAPRHLANCLGDLMDERDRTWVHDQVMEIEAPDAANILGQAVKQLLQPQKWGVKPR